MKDSSAALSMDFNNVPAVKKAKALRPEDRVDNLGKHTDIQVMDINNASDPHDEALNKTDPTANIKVFLHLSLLCLGKPRCKRAVISACVCFFSFVLYFNL
jgi:hypothetical protein